MNCDYIRYSPAETTTINTPDSRLDIDIPTEDSVISLLDSYLELNFEVIKRIDKSRYANGYDVQLVNFGPFALLFKCNLTTSCGKHLEDISHAHIVPLMYNYC